MFSYIPALWLLAPFSAVLALIVAFIFFNKLKSESEGTDKMIEIANHVKEGAMAYLKRQNKVIFIVFIVIFILLCVLAYLGIQNVFVPLIFLSGGFWSGVSG